MDSITFLRDLERRLEGHGITPEGTRWVLKALHPASSLDYEAIPDATYYKTVRAEYRAQTVIGAPASETWDLYVLRFPGDSTPIYAAAVPASDGPLPPGSYSSWVPLTVNPLSVVTTVNNSLDDADYTFSAMTTYTGILDTGVGNVGKLAFPAPIGDYESFRHSYASITGYLTSSALNDQGTVYAAQNAPDMIDADMCTTASVDSVPNSIIAQRRFFTTIPYNETDMAAKNPRYYVNQARNGFYMPLRLNGPTQPFSRMTMRSTFQGGVPEGGSVGGLDRVVIDQAGSYGVGSLPVGLNCTMADAQDAATLNTDSNSVPNLVANQTTSFNLMTDNTSCAMIIFRGLDPNATVTLKYIAGMEFDVDTDSPMRQFAKVPPKYDPKALEAYYAVVHELKDVYPSSWNSLGTIAAAIAAVAQRLWPVARPYVVSGLRLGLRALGESDGQKSMSAQQVVSVRNPSQGVRAGPRPDMGNEQRVAAVSTRKKKLRRKAKKFSPGVGASSK